MNLPNQGFVVFCLRKNMSRGNYFLLLWNHGTITARCCSSEVGIIWLGLIEKEIELVKSYIKLLYDITCFFWNVNIYVARNKQNLWTPHCASLRHLTPAPVPPRFETGAYRLGLPWARGPAAIVISGQLIHLGVLKKMGLQNANFIQIPIVFFIFGCPNFKKTRWYSLRKLCLFGTQQMGVKAARS